jgi:hypothetical protein
MTYLDRISELNDSIMHDIHHTDEFSINEVEERNRIVQDVMYGTKDWDDEYEHSNGGLI